MTKDVNILKKIPAEKSVGILIQQKLQVAANNQQIFDFSLMLLQK